MSRPKSTASNRLVAALARKVREFDYWTARADRLHAADPLDDLAGFASFAARSMERECVRLLDQLGRVAMQIGRDVVVNFHGSLVVVAASEIDGLGASA